MAKRRIAVEVGELKFHFLPHRPPCVGYLKNITPPSSRLYIQPLFVYIHTISFHGYSLHISNLSALPLSPKRPCRLPFRRFYGLLCAINTSFRLITVLHPPGPSSSGFQTVQIFRFCFCFIGFPEHRGKKKNKINIADLIYTLG